MQKREGWKPFPSLSCSGLILRPEDRCQKPTHQVASGSCCMGQLAGKKPMTRPQPVSPVLPGVLNSAGFTHHRDLHLPRVLHVLLDAVRDVACQQDR
jgi:hypothetical protein